MSSGPNVDRFMDEKKERKALANREAAKRSRIKKQKEWEGIVTERSVVLEDIENKKIEIENYDNDYSMTENENNSLDAGTLIVNKFLNCMNLYKKKLGIPDQTLETPAPTFNPWQSQFRH
ncbi:hypothetical protein RGQ29_029541 [Quercus rubra]|uniref:BZIP domain-containing protein n=1 Tax=Quercus rubra TaxID=3512 RepID=A0AAN7EF46_QUERU|nr:hypothetical protein RGQ29_029541 [Quercus rubra]